MNKRPRSVTIISWYLIIASILGAGQVAFMHNNPEMLKMAGLPELSVFQYVLVALGTIITISSAVLMLKGKSIGRATYIGWSILSMLVSFFTLPVKGALIPGVVVFLIIAFLLFRAKANDYFSGNQSALSNDS